MKRMKAFWTSGEGFLYLRSKFPNLSDAKFKKEPLPQNYKRYIG